MSHEEGICMASGRSAHFPFCKGEMGAYFLFQPAESLVRLFMVHKIAHTEYRFRCIKRKFHEAKCFALLEVKYPV